MLINENTRFYNTVFILSILYAYLQNSGFYGFSNDYYNSYINPEIAAYYPLQDKLGIIIATLTFFDFHVGVGVTSFFLAFSSGILLSIFFKIKSLNSYTIFLLFYLILLHTHPIIMSTSGAMRQGLLMSCLFISLFFLISEKKKISFFFIFIGIFMHNSGIVFFIFYIIANYINKIFIFINQKIKFTLLLALSFFFPLGCINLFKIFGYYPNFALIGSDFRLTWFLINLIYIIFFYINFKKFNSGFLQFLSIFLLFHALFSISMLFAGFSWQFERFNMITSIILILFAGLFLKKITTYLFYFISLFLYLVMTIYQGMYTVGLTLN
jgi:hypothetical protein